MKPLARYVPVIFAALVAMPLAAQGAEAAGAPAPAARYYPLVGNWQGEGRIDQPGGEPIELTLALFCHKASGGQAVTCEMVARNDKMSMTESDLMGVDPVSGKGHWYAITSEGETHDHITQWTDPDHMTADYAWAENGKKMHEHVTMAFSRGTNLDFNSLVTADGQKVSAFSGKLKRWSAARSG